jgi:DNA-binding response OmpR family regulator
MPGELNGIMLFDWLTAERPQLAERLIFVTGDTHDLALPYQGDGRPSRLLTKPFQVQEYLALVSAILEGHRTTLPRPSARKCSRSVDPGTSGGAMRARVRLMLLLAVGFLALSTTPLVRFRRRAAARGAARRRA